MGHREVILETAQKCRGWVKRGYTVIPSACGADGALIPGAAGVQVLERAAGLRPTVLPRRSDKLQIRIIDRGESAKGYIEKEQGRRRVSSLRLFA